VTADPVDVLIAVLDGLGDVSTKVEGRPATHIRLDPTGGTNQIAGYHDQALVEVHCVAPSNRAAATLARSARALIDATNGVVGSAVVSKTITSPYRLNDDADGRGHASFPARVFLHPTP
jgi:hypothetical protein